MRADDRPLRADARRNRNRILEAARRAFAVDGLAVSLDEIARRAGVGPGTLYRHFPTKEALFEAIVRERLRLLIERARAARTEPDAAAALFATVASVVADAEDKAELIDALTGSGVDLRTTVAATAGELRDEIGRLLSRAQDEGAVRADVGIAELMALVGGVITALRGPGLDTGRALAVLCDGLRSPEPPGQRPAWGPYRGRAVSGR
jgi:AcrR family transcriptional regulator